MKPDKVLKVGLVVVFLGLAVRSPLVIVPGMLLSLIGLLSWLWSRLLPESISCSVKLSRHRARQGDSITGELEIINDQPFPVPWLGCFLGWPPELGMEGVLLDKDYEEHRASFQSYFTLRRFEVVRRKFTLQCRKRGEYVLGPADLKVADPFGFAEGKRRIPAREKILIYPRVLPVFFKSFKINRPFGGKAAPSWVYEDPACFRGIREYIQTDPFSRIEWKATARTGQLQTRLYDASFASEVTLVINVSTSRLAWEVDSTILERTLVVAASLTQFFYQKGYRFGFYANSCVTSGRPAVVRIGAGEKHFQHSLEMLARLLSYHFTKCERVLARVGRTIGENGQLLLLTPVINKDIRRTMLELQARGIKVSLIFTGKEDPGDFKKEAFPVYGVAEKEDWDELAQITLTPLVR